MKSPSLANFYWRFRQILTRSIATNWLHYRCLARGDLLSWILTIFHDGSYLFCLISTFVEVVWRGKCKRSCKQSISRRTNDTYKSKKGWEWAIESGTKKKKKREEERERRQENAPTKSGEQHDQCYRLILSGSST